MSLQKADAQISNQEDLTEQDKQNIRDGIDFDASVSSNTSVEANTLKRSYPLSDEQKLANIEENAQVNVIRQNTTVTKTNNTYTLQATDVDKRLFIPAPCTVIVPNGLDANLEFHGKQIGTGDVEFVAETEGTLNVNEAFQKFTEGEHAYWGIVTLGGDEADLLGTLKLAE